MDKLLFRTLKKILLNWNCQSVVSQVAILSLQSRSYIFRIEFSWFGIYKQKKQTNDSLQDAPEHTKNISCFHLKSRKRLQQFIGRFSTDLMAV